MLANKGGEAYTGEAMLCRYADDWVCAFRYREDAERFYRVLPKRLEKFNLKVAPEKTRLLRFSRFHPSMKRRITFLGFEFFWKEDRKGTPRVMRRTSRKKLVAACSRIKEWIKLNRHLPVRDFFRRLNLRLRGHYNYYGVRGNSRLLHRFFDWATACAFKWLNRRGGKRNSFTWGRFAQANASKGRLCSRPIEWAQTACDKHFRSVTLNRYFARRARHSR